MTHNHSQNHFQNDSGPDKRHPAAARATPCASCPYRQQVPSGIWHEDEYAKLPRYDGDIGDQLAAEATSIFTCHQGDGDVCAGWLGHRDPIDLLAVRLGLSNGQLAPECAYYTTDIPLFASGEEAHSHGIQDICRPSEKATSAIQKITKKRNLKP